MQRNTFQKRQVMDILRAMANHPSAEMVYEAVHKQHPSISKATVYRILKDEASCGNLRSVDVPWDVNRYDHRTDEHWHIRCRVCGKIGDVELKKGCRAGDVLEMPSGWEVENVSMALCGICENCRRSENADGGNENQQED